MEHNVFKEVDNVCLIPRILGLSPFVLHQDTFQITYKLLMITVLHLIIMFATMCNSLMVFNFSAGKNSVYSFLVNVNIASYVMSLLTFVIPLTKMNYFNRSLSYISSVDRLLERLGYKINAYPSLVSKKSRLIHWLLFFSLHPLTTFRLPIQQVPFFLCLFWPIAVTVLVLEQIISILALLRSRLEVLISTVEDIATFSTDFKRLEDIARCHNLLCNSGLCLNKVYTGSFLLFCSFSFTTIVHEVYVAYYCTLPDHEDILEAITGVSWVLFSTMFLWRLTTSCSVLSDKANEFNTLLYRVMMEDKSEEIMSNVKLRLHIAKKPVITFTATGFFNLDYSLLHTVIAAVTTYLVILIQFDETSNNSTSESTVLEVLTTSVPEIFSTTLEK